MSSDEDADIDRLRSDLIKSIRSKKSRENSITDSLPKAVDVTSCENASTSFAATILDTDIDDLEALRRAALVTLKKSGETASSEWTSPSNSQLQWIQDGASSLSHFTSQSSPLGPILTGPTASYSQFPAPPPAYKSRFFNHQTPGFRPAMRNTRSNLIVIQTGPPPETQYETTGSSTKLMLPQDRYLRYDKETKEDGAKRKRDDKWSRYDDTSSNNSEASYDLESEEETESDLRSDRSEASIGGTSTKSDTLEEPPGVSQDVDYSDGSKSIDVLAGPELSSGTDSNTGEEFENGLSQVQPVSSSTFERRRRTSDEDLLLEEPVHAIEFLDEPVDEDVVHKLVPLVDDTETTSQPGQVQEIDSKRIDSPTAKELKKQKLKSELQAVKQQLEQIYRKKKAVSSSSSSSRRNREPVEEGFRHSSRDLNGESNGKRSSSKSSDRQDEPSSKYSRRENTDMEGVRRSNKLLSSVVVVASRSGRVCE